MAVSGLVLVGFVIGHLVGNLQIFSDPDHINGYAAFLHANAAVLWGFRLTLLTCVVVHVWAATVLTLENKKARGTEPAVKKWIRATLASRYIRWSGYVVLAFIIYHLAHFTIGTAQSDTFKGKLPEYTMTADYKVAGFPVIKAGTVVEDVHSMVILGFQNKVVSLFYIIAVGLLSFHLLHGIDSLFQTLGWRSSRWSPALRAVVAVICIVYFLGNLVIPGSIMIGAKGLREGYTGPGASSAHVSHR